jgi:hypothetical protein
LGQEILVIAAKTFSSVSIIGGACIRDSYTLSILGVESVDTLQANITLWLDAVEIHIEFETVGEDTIVGEGKIEC